MTGLGKIGEDIVASHYESLGYKVVDRNFIQSRGKQMGELDLVTIKNSEIVFVEVKTRASKKFGTAFEAVDFFKQRKLVNTVKLYLSSHPQFRDFSPRIDVAAVDVDNPEKPVIILTNAIEDLC